MCSLTRQQDGVLQAGGEGAGQHVPEEGAGGGEQEPVHLDLRREEWDDDKIVLTQFSPSPQSRGPG